MPLRSTPVSLSAQKKVRFLAEIALLKYLKDTNAPDQRGSTILFYFYQRPVTVANLRGACSLTMNGSTQDVLSSALLLRPQTFVVTCLLTSVE